MRKVDFFDGSRTFKMIRRTTSTEIRGNHKKRPHEVVMRTETRRNEEEAST